MKYRIEIDGLRAVAIIPVILFHLGYNNVRGGYMGVDVFFVISGYLITGILTNDIKNQNFSFYRFWIRRIKRLFPLLLSVVLFTLIFASFFVFKPTVKSISKDVFPLIFSYFNFHALFDFGDYWGEKSGQSFFLHAWSLSVEEQFYFFYPFFLFFSYKFFKNFFIPILLITIASFVFFIYKITFSENIDFAFYMLPTRIWELSIGGLVSLIKIREGQNSFTNLFFSSIGFVMIVWSYFFGAKTTDFTVIFPIIGSILIILYSSTNELIGKFLSMKILVFIGKISYSLYLWHWVIIIMMNNMPINLCHFNRHILNGFELFLTFLLSILTFVFIENKTRRYIHTPKIVLLGFIVVSGLTIYLQSDLFNTNYKSNYLKQISYMEYYNIIPNQSGLRTFLKENNLTQNIHFPKKQEKFKDAYKNEGIIESEHFGMPKMLLLGDSHGVMWAKLLSEISDEFKTSLSCYTSNGTSPFFNIRDLDLQVENNNFSKLQRKAYAKSIVENIEKWKPKIVVIACRWDVRYDEIDSNFYDLLIFLEKKNIKVLLFTQPPLLPFKENINVDQYLTYLDIQPKISSNMVLIGNNALVFQKNELIQSLSKRFMNILVYDVFQNMTEGNNVKITLDSNVLYFDDDHLSYEGTYFHKENIVSIIKPILN